MNSESTSSDHISFPNAVAPIKQEIVISKDQSICVAGPSMMVFETSTPIGQYSPGIHMFLLYICKTFVW